jgi:methylmalonyl-CoA/ethylmalonyl-CoA epimerase
MSQETTSDPARPQPSEATLPPRVGRIHHVAVVVRDLDAAVATFRDALGLALETVQEIPSDGVRIAFLPTGESKLELVAPTDPGTGVARYLEKQGEGFHHVCYEVPDLAAALGDYAAAGVELIDRAPRRGAEGPVAFLHPRSCHGVLVELIEAPGGPAWEPLGYELVPETRRAE